MIYRNFFVKKRNSTLSTENLEIICRLHRRASLLPWYLPPSTVPGTLEEWYSWYVPPSTIPGTLEEWYPSLPPKAGGISRCSRSWCTWASCSSSRRRWSPGWFRAAGGRGTGARCTGRRCPRSSLSCTWCTSQVRGSLGLPSERSLALAAESYLK